MKRRTPNDRRLRQTASVVGEAFAVGYRGVRGTSDLTVLSLGAGVQSTTLLLMAENGEFDAKPDYAIFADVGWEPRRVYEHLAWLESVVKTIPILRVSRGNLRDDFLRKKEGLRAASMPLYTRDAAGHAGILRRQCTQEYKIAPLNRKIRGLIGRKGTAEIWFGISLDEVERMKDPPMKWATWRYPLIEKLMSRKDCLTWMETHGYPRPPKSACIGCPYHSDAYWNELREMSPDEWQDAVDFDHEIRTGLKGVRSSVYLHRSLKPLDEVPLTNHDKGQLEIGDFLEETGSLNICTGGCFL